MPEGPEIHAQAVRLQFLKGERPRLFSPYLPELENLQGRRVREVGARGKAFLIHFEGKRTLYAHMQLYGRWIFGKPGQVDRTNRQLRLSLSTESQEARLYSATDIEVLSNLKDHPYLSRLGPDLLDPGVSLQDLQNQLQDRRFSGRRLAGLLLDQGFWAGPGNYLRSEILFCAGLSPESRPRDLNPEQQTQLARAARGLALRSLASKGLTNHPRLVQKAKKLGQTRRWYRHWVFNRSGRPCWICDSPIRKEEWTGRRLYRCLECGGGGRLELDFQDVE
ncbi:MAG: DNA-formamidopyrimidine glycosylase family protein [Vulcanimicrobiota bacterium]